MFICVRSNFCLLLPFLESLSSSTKGSSWFRLSSGIFCTVCPRRSLRQKEVRYVCGSCRRYCLVGWGVGVSKSGVLVSIEDQVILFSLQELTVKKEFTFFLEWIWIVENGDNWVCPGGGWDFLNDNLGNIFTLLILSFLNSSNGV